MKAILALKKIIHSVKSIISDSAHRPPPKEIADLGFEDIRNHCLGITESLINQYIQNGLYNRDKYLVRKPVSDRIKDFIGSSKKIMFLDGPPGIGKSACLANLADGMLDQLGKDTIVLMINSANIRPERSVKNAVKWYLEEKLQLPPSFLSCLQKFAGQMRRNVQLYLLVDALDEFESDSESNYLRFDFFSDLMNLMEKELQGVNLKLMATFHWDIMKADVGLNTKAMKRKFEDILWFDESNSPFCTIPPLSLEEKRKIYALYCQRFSNHTPSFTWEESVKRNLVNLLKTPMDIGLLSQSFNNIGFGRPTKRWLIKSFIRSVINSKPEQKKLNESLIGLMIEQRTTKLTLEMIEREDIILYYQIVTKKAKSGDSWQRHQTEAYRYLRENGVIAEDMVYNADGLEMPQISYANSIVFNLARRNIERQDVIWKTMGKMLLYTIIFTLVLILGLAACYVISIFVAMSYGTESEVLSQSDQESTISSAHISILGELFKSLQERRIELILRMILLGILGIVLLNSVFEVISKQTYRYFVLSKLNLIKLSEQQKILRQLRYGKYFGFFLILIIFIVMAEKLTLPGNTDAIIAQPEPWIYKLIISLMVVTVAVNCITLAFGLLSKHREPILHIFASPNMTIQRIMSSVTLVLILIISSYFLQSNNIWDIYIDKSLSGITDNLAIRWRETATELSNTPVYRNLIRSHTARMARWIESPEEARDFIFYARREYASNYESPELPTAIREKYALIYSEYPQRAGRLILSLIPIALILAFIDVAFPFLLWFCKESIYNRSRNYHNRRERNPNDYKNIG